MLDKKVIVVMPAYNAAGTLQKIYAEVMLKQLPLEANSDDFVFDNQMLAQVLWYGHTVGEISCPAKYFAEASSINFRRSVNYDLGVCIRR